jgi:zinc/manganese transport system permease protein
MMLLHYPFALHTLLLCLVLTAVHSYLGYHVVRRGVIFVDLSLAQLAALGTAVGVLFGFGENSPLQSYFFSLAFALAGAGLFVWFRKIQSKVPIEALIGITYAAAIAIALVVLEKTSEGTEHIKEMLAGSLLTISPKQLISVIILYSIVSLVHIIFRRQILCVTEAPEFADKRKYNVGLWDFVFYTTFAFVVTTSVNIAGVLLVFAFLIIPAVAGMLVSVKRTGRIAYGWIFGAVGSVIGLELSLRLDWSSGPTIVVVLLLLLILTAIFVAILKRPSLKMTNAKFLT